MEIDDLLEELEAIDTMPAITEDCGCGQGKELPVATPADVDVESLERELDALEATEPADAELEGFGQAIDLDDELEFALTLDDDESSGVPTLEEVLALAKEYPGLKISFGF